MWRALYAAASFQRPWGKYVIAVNEDIDPDNTDAVFWAMSYRADPERDTHLLRHQDPGHGPRTASAKDSALLVNATLRRDAPPLSLPEPLHGGREGLVGTARLAGSTPRGAVATSPPIRRSTAPAIPARNPKRARFAFP